MNTHSQHAGRPGSRSSAEPTDQGHPALRIRNSGATVRDRQAAPETQCDHPVLRSYESITPQTLLAERKQFIGRVINGRRKHVDCAIDFSVIAGDRPWNLLRVRYIVSELAIPLFGAGDEAELLMGLQAWAIAYRMGWVPSTCYLRLFADGTATMLAQSANLRTFNPWKIMDWAEGVLDDPANTALDWLSRAA
ncbi:hypothetical protein E4T66_18390 [Sinimarinibacterium sp. CAU 1509]|uniref:hypothetical protein n=1 Tax=Sinimarinibacterium sp. CAU 1509 TaxID=2562283 RepID=UPI0010AC2F59|nr:hypothetical protein [Sinimarinibacterium sp. CAU 1509]TJY57376.1 hypothetical protein E4T66_18390 [Sinimarinibacterium sp. CAU 1509]